MTVYDEMEERFITIMENYDTIVTPVGETIYIVHKGNFDPYDMMDLFMVAAYRDYADFILLLSGPLTFSDGELFALTLADTYSGLCFSAWVEYDVDYHSN